VTDADQFFCLPSVNAVDDVVLVAVVVAAITRIRRGEHGDRVQDLRLLEIARLKGAVAGFSAK